MAAIQMARPAKDNKFEVVTSQRIFVFRTDEGDDGDGEDDPDQDVKVIMKVMVSCSVTTPLAGHAAATRPRPAGIWSATLWSWSPLPEARRPGAEGGQV